MFGVVGRLLLPSLLACPLLYVLSCVAAPGGICSPLVIIAGGGARGRVAIVSSEGRLDPAEGSLLCSLCFEGGCNAGSGLPGVRSCETS